MDFVGLAGLIVGLIALLVAIYGIRDVREQVKSLVTLERNVVFARELHTVLVMAEMPRTDVMALDDALQTLAKIDEQQSRIVEMRFFGGLTTEQAAEVLGISRSTAKRDWNVARAWLSRQMKRGARGNS